MGSALESEKVYKGALKLTNVTTRVKNTPNTNWRLVRRVSLGYDIGVGTPGTFSLGASVRRLNCDKDSTSLRYLIRITEAAYARDGQISRLPALTFEYRLKDRHFTETKWAGEPGYGHQGHQTGATVDLLDLGGPKGGADGILDRVEVIEENGLCILSWRQGLYGGGFAKEEQRWELPTWPWWNKESPSLWGEGCTLSGQFTYRTWEYIDSGPPKQKVSVPAKVHVSYHFLDITGPEGIVDGRLDLLTNIWAAGGMHREVTDDSIINPARQFPLPDDCNIPPIGTGPTFPGPKFPGPDNTGGIVGTVGDDGLPNPPGVLPLFGVSSAVQAQ